MKHLCFGLLVVFVLSGCAAPAAPASSANGAVGSPVSQMVQPSAKPPASASPFITPTTASTATPEPIYASAFGIDYANPEPYRQPGKQTRLADVSIFDPLRLEPEGLPQLEAIFRWIRKDFENWKAGGSTIGVVTAEELMERRELGGCHDYALVYAAAARALGYPSVLVDAAGVPWIKKTAAGETGPYTGHVFVEVYTGDRWILVDSTNGWYIPSGYDPAEPLISIGAGFYVMRKGVDTWGYDIHTNQELQQLMDQTAAELKGQPLALSPTNVQRWQ